MTLRRLLQSLWLCNRSERICNSLPILAVQQLKQFVFGVDVEFRVDMFHVTANSVDGNHERLGTIRLGITLGNKEYYFGLTLG